MNQKDFDNIVERCKSEIQSTLNRKGVEYAPSEDRLSNFKMVSSLTGVSPIMVAIILMSKHYVSICEMANDPLGHNEGYWDEKLGDVRNYTVLIKALINEIENEEDSDEQTS